MNRVYSTVALIGGFALQNLLSISIVAVGLLMFVSTANAGQKFNPEVSGASCEMIDVMSDLTPGKVLYSYRADPTCGNVRTSKDFRTSVQLTFDKLGNVTGSKVTKTVTSDENNGG